MNFDEAFEAALTKATEKHLLFSESIIFGDDCMFVVQPKSWGREIIIKFMTPEQLHDDDNKMTSTMKKYLSTPNQPFQVRFLNVVDGEQPLPSGFAQDGNDALYGFLLTPIQFNSKENWCLVKSDQLMSEIVVDSMFPDNTRFIGYEPDVCIDEDIVFSSIWQSDRKFLFSNHK